MTSRVFGHILKFYLFIHKKLSSTSITQIQIKIFWYALHFIKTFMQRFRMGTLWLTEKSSCLAFFASTLLPTYHNRMGHIRKKQLLSSVFSPLYMQVRRRYLFTILYCKGEKSRTGPAIQHTQAPARSRTLFHCSMCVRA